jgi:hypothetical protein
MNEYKLKYTDKQEAINDLVQKGVIKNSSLEGFYYKKNTLAVVFIGEIIDQPAVYDENENIISEATYIEGYHVDVMTREPINFQNEITPQNPVHKFG